MKLTIKTIFPPSSIALASAFLFGSSTPAAKLLIGNTNPQLLAGLLYLGSGFGLSIVAFVATKTGSANTDIRLKRTDLPWLGGAILFGGIIAPLLLMIGLKTTTGGTASLLLNLEAVFTSLLAWFAFKENFDRRIFLGMVSIVVGSVFLSWQPGVVDAFSLGAMAIVGSCLCWGFDNNFTRNISDTDAVHIAALKGLIAGTVNSAIALLSGAHIPTLSSILGAAAIGFLGYGVSLVLFIRGLRILGTARTGAYFSTAPFAGAILSLIILHEQFSVNLFLAALFMAFGIWLHLTEHHEHEHIHEELEHEHFHVHDDQHQHNHEHGTPILHPHKHWHKHEQLIHSHPHFPDSQHRHEH